MTSRSLPFTATCAAFAACAALALPAAPAAAAGAKVMLIVRNENGVSSVAAANEPAFIENTVRWNELGVLCFAAEEHATVGKNPSGTVKVTGTGQPVESSCFYESNHEPVQGSVAIKSVSVAKTAAVKLTGDIETTVGGCSYRATKLSGTQAFGELYADLLTGEGKLMPHNAKSCAASTSVEDEVGVGDAARYLYLVELMS